MKINTNTAMGGYDYAAIGMRTPSQFSMASPLRTRNIPEQRQFDLISARNNKTMKIPPISEYKNNEIRPRTLLDSPMKMI